MVCQAPFFVAWGSIFLYNNSDIRPVSANKPGLWYLPTRAGFMSLYVTEKEWNKKALPWKKQYNIAISWKSTVYYKEKRFIAPKGEDKNECNKSSNS